MYEQQSIEPDQAKRKKLVWEIDRRLQEDGARPIIFNYRLGTCHYPRVHAITVMTNSLFNGWRLDNAWLRQ
jgi:peptide/nickel transport system substrate-binding protein